MGRGGAHHRFTGGARKRAARPGGERALQGDRIQRFAFWGLANCPARRAEEKPMVSIDALQARWWFDSWGTIHCPPISRAAMRC